MLVGSEVAAVAVVVVVVATCRWIGEGRGWLVGTKLVELASASSGCLGCMQEWVCLLPLWKVLQIYLRKWKQWISFIFRSSVRKDLIMATCFMCSVYCVCVFVCVSQTFSMYASCVVCYLLNAKLAIGLVCGVLMPSPNTVWKFHEINSGQFLFILHLNLWRYGIIEGALTLILKHYKAHFDP